MCLVTRTASCYWQTVYHWEVKPSSLKGKTPIEMITLETWNWEYVICVKPTTCGKCLGDHPTATCTNGWVCRRCKTSGHKMIDCPVVDTVSTKPKPEQERSSQQFSQPTPIHSTDATGTVVYGQEKGGATTAKHEKLLKSPRQSRRRKKDKNKNSDLSHSSVSIRHFFSTAESATPSQRDKSKLVRSPPTPAEQLNIETKKSKNQAKNSYSHSSDGSNESETEY